MVYRGECELIDETGTCHYWGITGVLQNQVPATALRVRRVFHGWYPKKCLEHCCPLKPLVNVRPNLSLEDALVDEDSSIWLCHLFFFWLKL